MREIKFRAWHQYDRRMVYGPSDDVISPSWVLAMCSANNIEPMQYTGLKDKNGKEIYEGDIVQTNDGDQIYLDVVKWSEKDAAWEFENIHGLCTVLANDIDLKRSEVMGSIYENPELIEVSA